MIDLQSSAIAQSQDIGPAIPPLPAGEGRGEGELNHRGRQSAMILSMPSLSASEKSVFIRLPRRSLAKADVHPW
jgi:hypothetical protein